MILGVDHIALSCAEVDGAIGVLADSGFTAHFVERDAPNRVEKRPLLRSYSELHSLAFCRPSRGVAIELTAHGNALARSAPSPYRVLFTASPGGVVADGASDRAAEVVAQCIPCHRLTGGSWKPFSTDVLWDDAAEPRPPTIRALVVRAPSLAVAEDYWTRGLGCEKRGGDGDRFAHLFLKSPLPNWALDIVLVHEPHAEQPTIDSPGFPVLALISNRLDEDLARLLSLGAKATSEFALRVNGKALAIGVVRGPDDNLVELIQIGRT